MLTLFERLSFEQLPFYLHLMKHLAGHGIPVPDPQADRSGDILHTVCGKPAAVVDKLAGHSELAPTERHCALSKYVSVVTCTVPFDVVNVGFREQSIVFGTCGFL